MIGADARPVEAKVEELATTMDDTTSNNPMSRTRTRHRVGYLERYPPRRP
jgi:hypothetical protein